MQNYNNFGRFSFYANIALFSPPFLKGLLLFFWIARAKILRTRCNGSQNGTCSRMVKNQNPPHDKRTVHVLRREGKIPPQFEGEEGSTALSSRSGFNESSLFCKSSSSKARSRCSLGKYFSIMFINTILTEYFWWTVVESILYLHRGQAQECLIALNKHCLQNTWPQVVVTGWK